MYLQWLLLFYFSVAEMLTANFTEVSEPIKNETGLIDRTYCNYENKETSVYEFPWLVAISDFCSGSLINARYVLTSAWCAFPGHSGHTPTEFTVLMGDINFKSNHKKCKNITSMAECVTFEEYGVEECIKHPLYKGSFIYTDYDVGLLRLNRTVAYKEYMRPICLPTFQTVTPKPGDTLYLTVWVEDTQDSKVLKKKILTTSITRAECQEKTKECYSFIPNFTPIYTYDNSECIIVPKFHDDIPTHVTNGVPVMSFNNSQWKMEGILVTYGDVYCIDLPQIYTRISTYLGWIEEAMRPWN